MKKDYTTIRIKISHFTVGDYEAIRHLAIKHDVPDRASVRIDTNGTGTHIVFEWAALETTHKKVEPNGYRAKNNHIDEWRIYYK